MAYTPTIGFAGKSGLNFPGQSSGGGVGAFNINPSPQRGRGPYGQVPGAIGLPPSRYAQVNAIHNLSSPTNQLFANLGRDLAGDIDWNVIQDEAARFGVSSGMPGSPFSGIRGLRIGEETSHARRRQGLQDYLAATAGIGALQTDPNLAANIATQNAVWASAPDPQAAAEQQMALWEKQLNALSLSGGGGTWRSMGGGGGVRSAGPAGGTGFGSSWDDFADARNRWADYGPIGAFGRAGEFGFGVPLDDPNFGLGSGMNTQGFGSGSDDFDLTYWGDPFDAPELTGPI